MTRTRTRKLMALALFSLLLTITTSEAQAQRYRGPLISRQRVHFQRGRTTAILKGIAKTPGDYEYVLGARAGQTMTVHITSSNRGVEFSIWDARQMDVDDNAMGVMDWSGRLEESGDYTIILTNNRAHGDRKPSYTLEVTIR